MKRLIFILLALIFNSQFCFANELLYEDALGRQIFKGEGYGQEVIIKVSDDLMLSITPKYSDKISENSPLGGSSEVFLGYVCLVPRGSLKDQPKPFDDVTGDGNPDILILEITDKISNASGHSTAVRLFSVINGKIEESQPYFGMIGEMLHFDDFNKDGVFELVNTDSERYFLYSRDGFPISDYVLIYDTYYKKYYQSVIMVNE